MRLCCLNPSVHHRGKRRPRASARPARHTSLRSRTQDGWISDEYFMVYAHDCLYFIVFSNHYDSLPLHVFSFFDKLKYNLF